MIVTFFHIEREYWEKPELVYLDKPFMDTDLYEWFNFFIVDDKPKKKPISINYHSCGIELDRICLFAQKIGVQTGLSIIKTEISTEHQEWEYLRKNGGNHSSRYLRSEDYIIPELANFLANNSIKKSRLIWRTMTRLCQDNDTYLKAIYARNSKSCAEEKSTLIHDLSNTQWIPQKGGDTFVFCHPRDAVAEKLPSDFTFQTELPWLRAIEFGVGVVERKEAEQREQQRHTAEFKQKEALILSAGFDSIEEFEEIAELKKKDPEALRRLLEGNVAHKAAPAFPCRPVANPERVIDRIREDMATAPNKEYETRDRSVRTSRGAIDPDPMLRDLYKNDNDEMVCQVCQEEMPFRKRDGGYFFVAKEVLSRECLPQEQEEQFLALCPLCAAMYDEYIKNDKKAMSTLRENLINTDNLEVPITLAGREMSLRFVERHLLVLRSILNGYEYSESP